MPLSIFDNSQNSYYVSKKNDTSVQLLPLEQIKRTEEHA